MCRYIIQPGLWTGPRRILQQHLAAQLLSDTETFLRPETFEALGPVLILGTAHRFPVASDELGQTTSDHLFMVSDRVGGGKQIRSHTQLARVASGPGDENYLRIGPRCPTRARRALLILDGSCPWFALAADGQRRPWLLWQ